MFLLDRGKDKGFMGGQFITSKMKENEPPILHHGEKFNFIKLEKKKKCMIFSIYIFFLLKK